MKSYFVYILASKRDGVLYIGVTSDLEKRIWEHRNDIVEGFTSEYHVHMLVCYEQTENVMSALEREKQLKKWRREKKVWLIEKMNSEWEDLYDKRQCEILGVPRSSLYYQPRSVSDEDRKTMDIIDALYTEHPFFGNRRIKAELNLTHGIDIGRDKVRTLMRTMGIEALYPKKNLSLPNPQHKLYPYLLRHLNIEKPNQVWSTDITYVKLKEGFAYLIAIIDWYSRYVINWKVFNTLEIEFCLECLEEALEQEKPSIFNSDQGSHFTSPRFTDILEARTGFRSAWTDEAGVWTTSSSNDCGEASSRKTSTSVSTRTYWKLVWDCRNTFHSTIPDDATNHSTIGCPQKFIFQPADSIAKFPLNFNQGTFNNLMQHLFSQRIPHRESSRQIVSSDGN